MVPGISRIFCKYYMVKVLAQNQIMIQKEINRIHAVYNFFISYTDLITYFDRMRNKRNQAIYDVAGMITETEARNLFTQAKEFVQLIRQRLALKQPR